MRRWRQRWHRLSGNGASVVGSGMTSGHGPGVRGMVVLFHQAMDELDADLARAAAVLLEDRVVRRVIKQHRQLPGIGLQVPHARCYTLARRDLEALVERDELAIDPAALPDDV